MKLIQSLKKKQSNQLLHHNNSQVQQSIMYHRYNLNNCNITNSSCYSNNRKSLKK